MVLLNAPHAERVGGLIVLLKEVAGVLTLDLGDNGLQGAVRWLSPALTVQIEVAHERLVVDGGAT
eukprot:4002462-Lingulodinium_polyedra.AAC.1